MLRLKLLTIVFLLAAKFSIGQDTSNLNKVISFPDKLFSSLERKTSSVEQKLNRQTTRYLDRLQRQEQHLKRKLYKKDSVLAKEIFKGTDEHYGQLKNQLTNSATQSFNRYQGVYSGHLDSLSTALNFLKDQHLSTDPALQKTLDQYQDLQQKLNASEQINLYLQQRQQLLKQQFEKLGMLKQVTRYRKQVFYYKEQVRSYKELFEDPSKLEAKLMDIVLSLPQFKDFFAKNSMLGSLFALRSNSSISTTSLQGLQTRASVSQSLIDRFGSGPNVTQQLQQNVQNAQGQLDQLKSKFRSFSSGSYGNTGAGDIPGFKPNNQKTKSFLQRLEYGGNIQSQKARYFFPVTSDIALSLGYKINDRSVIGLGAAYKLGWGNNWSNLKITHQGIGLRSYLEWKIKGGIYFSGGYEQNYRSMISSVNQLSDYSAWQTSGLLGVSKRYTVSKKMKGDVKLLWDFMSYQQIPKTQPILFRVGYSLK